jgi:four helix bundle protein
MSIRTFRDLIVWQKSMALVTSTYNFTNCFPEAEKFGLVCQLRRAVVSIPTNIAEGYGRRATKDYRRFLHIALGSVYEFQTLFEISINLHYLKDSGEIKKTDEDIREIERMLTALILKNKRMNKGAIEHQAVTVSTIVPLCLCAFAPLCLCASVPLCLSRCLYKRTMWSSAR